MSIRNAAEKPVKACEGLPTLPSRGVQPSVTRVLLIRRIAEAWLEGQRRGRVLSRNRRIHS